MEEKVIAQKKPPKSPALAGVLSGFIPGTGALYNGQILKGIVFLITFPGLITMQQHGSAQPFVALLLAGFYIYQIIDAIQTAKLINRIALKEGEAEEEKIEEFPKAVKAGSVFWGAFLMGLGGIFLLANFEVLSYGTIFDFWPLAVIAVGIKLVVDYFSKKE